MLMSLIRSLRAQAFTGVLLLTLLALSGGCASKEKKVATPSADADKYLFDQGTQALEKHKWLRAREYFRQLVDNYPQSRFRPDAKLGLGDTYLGDGSVGSLILGASEFREFLTFFPTHERAYYAQYKLALCHYEQIAAPQRDQTQTKEAIKEFETFVERFPDSKLIKEGRQKLQECRDRLSDADYTVGVFYYRTRWYPGAIVRLRGILKDNPGFTRRDALYYYLAETYVKVNLQPEAVPLLDKLVTEFPKSDYLDKAKKLTADIQNGVAGPTPKQAPAKKDAKAGGTGKKAPTI
jgi:outer membrane protein assembly factor BamD